MGGLAVVLDLLRAEIAVEKRGALCVALYTDPEADHRPIKPTKTVLVSEPEPLQPRNRIIKANLQFVECGFRHGSRGFRLE